MEVPTVSAKDVKSSLSKESPLPKKSLRKSLPSYTETIRPTCFDTWEIEEIMQRHLGRFKLVRSSIPWSELKLLSEEERIKTLKKEWKIRNAGNEDAEKMLRKQADFHLHGVYSSIRKHILSSAIICGDLEPSFMKNCVLDRASIQRVPILILFGLRTLTKKILGFPCSCLGIKNDGARDGSFVYPLHQKIVEKAVEIEVPGHEYVSMMLDDQKDLISQEKDSYSASKAKSGMDTSSASSDETMESGDSEESSKTLLVKASKRKSLAETINRKRCASHPYLRKFSKTGLKKQNSLHDPPESTS